MFGSIVSASDIQTAEPDCQTQTCIEAANQIKEYVDFNADPCDDFYKYACMRKQ